MGMGSYHRYMGWALDGLGLYSFTSQLYHGMDSLLLTLFPYPPPHSARSLTSLIHCPLVLVIPFYQNTICVACARLCAQRNCDCPLIILTAHSLQEREELLALVNDTSLRAKLFPPGVRF